MTKKYKELNNILNECLERLLVKGETIEQCLQSYPEHAAEIEPLLQTAMATRKVLAIQPDAEFKARARYQLRSALQEVKPKRALPFLSWQPRWATVVVTILALLLASSGTVAAASDSMPDSPLYPVKLATEQVQLTLTTSEINKTRLYAKLADRRVAEIVYVINKGEDERIESIIQRLNNHVAMIASLPLVEKEEKRELPERAPTMLAPTPAETGKEELPAEAPVTISPRQAEAEDKNAGRTVPDTEKAKLKALLERNAINHPAVLRAVLKKAPPSAKAALRRAIEESKASYDKALKDLDQPQRNSR